MFSSYIQRKLGILDIKTTRDQIHMIGVPRLALEYDIQKHWRTTVITNNMFNRSNSSTISIEKFWALEMTYILGTFYNQDKGGRVPKRTIKKLGDLIDQHTWVGKTKNIDAKPVDLKSLDKISIYKPMQYQLDFIEHYIKAVPAFNLKGYMLDSAAGSGKTLTQLYLAHALNPEGRKVFIVPKNSVEEVWEDTIKDKWNDEGKVWHSLSNAPLTLDYKYYIFHYEQLDRAYTFINSNQREFKDTYLGLDESHNFNVVASNRTQRFLDLAGLECITNVIWASGTPISKLGSECIPFIKSIDPLFTPKVEQGFRKIYGSDAKRGLDILRHRIGHLKYHIASVDSVDVETEIIPYNVTFDDANKFTMETITGELKKFMVERTEYYDTNKASYHQMYNLGLKMFQQSSDYRKDPKSFDRYTAYIKIISKGYDPKVHNEEAQFCNHYEAKVIMPTLPSIAKKNFKAAKSVVKYLRLKVLGETLGLLSKYRSTCFSAMIPHMNLPELIDGAKKKTIIFSSYVDVVKDIGDQLIKEGYQPLLVYGETNANLSPIVKQFYNDPDANPLIATFQSLSTAVPLTAANRIIMTNQPFRDRIKTQAIARAARKGQDMNVDVFDVLLDTGEKENISTRNKDILEWSAEMVAAIMGTDNLDLSTLSNESNLIETLQTLPDIQLPKDVMAAENESYPEPQVPYILYASSQDGFINEDVKLYVDLDVAKLQAVAELMTDSRVDLGKRSITIVNASDLHDLPETIGIAKVVNKVDIKVELDDDGYVDKYVPTSNYKVGDSVKYSVKDILEDVLILYKG